MYAEWSFREWSLATDIKKEQIKHIEYTNGDTDSDVESTKVSVPSLGTVKTNEIWLLWDSIF